nr:hypothetical protein [Tanacetum cinerariifolium]
MTLTFADTHNMVAYLSKSDASEGFNQIINFLDESNIEYDLTVNPTIYVSCIKYFWRTVVVKSSNEVTRLQALVDKKKVVVTESGIRDAMHLDDAEGVDCLPNEEIFTELACMGYEKPSTKLTFYKAFFSSQWKFLIHTILQSMSAKCTSWNEFSSAMASTMICLSTGRKFNFSKYIFESLVRNVDSSSKFYMYPRFIHLIIQNQLGDLSTHSTKYISPALTQKVFANMRRVGKGCSGVETPLFEGMLVAREPEEQSDTEEQAQPQGTDFPMSLVQEALDACAALARRVEHLEQDKVAQDLEIIKLKTRVKNLEKTNKVKTLKLRRLRKVGTSQRVDTSDDTLMEDVSNQGRIIDKLDKDEDVVKEIEEVRENTDDAQAEGMQADIYHIDMDHAAKVLISAAAVVPAAVPETISAATVIPTVIAAPVNVVVPSTRRKRGVATPLARKVPVVDYQIILVNNKHRYKIIKADGTQPMYASFITMLKNIDRDDLETLWSIVKERFSTSKPNNFSDEYLLTTLKTMFGRTNGQDNVWKSQRNVHGQALVKSWKLLTSCGVHIISFTTTQIILLVERRYPLSKFTLEQMLNVVRLQVEEQSEMSLELIRFTRQQL